MSDRVHLEDRLLPGLPGTLLAELRGDLAASVSDETLQLRIQATPVLLSAVLRRSASEGRSGQPLPLDARGAWLRMGGRRIRRFLETLLLLMPPQPDTSRAELRAAALRRAGSELQRLVYADAPCATAGLPTLLTLLELVPVQAARAHRPDPQPEAWGKGVLALLGKPIWYHPWLVQVLGAMSKPETASSDEIGQAASLLLAAVALSSPDAGPEGLDPSLGQSLGLSPWQWVALSEGNIHG